MNKKNLLVAAGLVILATACKENDTVRPSAITDGYAYKSQTDSSNPAESDSIVKRRVVLPIKTQPIEHPGADPSLGKGKDILEQQEEIN